MHVKRERKREGERDRQRQRDKQRQRHRETERERHRVTGSQRERGGRGGGCTEEEGRKTGGVEGGKR